MIEEMLFFQVMSLQLTLCDTFYVGFQLDKSKQMKGIIGVGNEESVFSYRKFLGGLVIKSCCFHCYGPEFDLCLGN